MSTKLNGRTDLLPEGFTERANAVIEAADLTGNFELIVLDKDEFLCKETIYLKVEDEDCPSRIVRYFDLCANTITISHYERTADTSSEYGTTVDIVTPVNILAYNSLPETHPYRKKMDVLKSIVQAGLNAGS